MNSFVSSLYISKITDNNINCSILCSLPTERQYRINHAIRSEKSVQLFTSSLLLSYVLKKCGMSIFDVKVTEYGKPYVDGEVYFNLSHSDQYVVMAISRNDIGVDIQKKTIIPKEAIKSFCNSEDQNKEPIGIYHNSYVWCRQESFLKCLGVGWNKKIIIYPSILSNEIQYNGNKYFFKDFAKCQDYFLSLCQKRHSERFVVKEMTKHELELFFKSN